MATPALLLSARRDDNCWPGCAVADQRFYLRQLIATDRHRSGAMQRELIALSRAGLVLER
jgi:hypothetical protein